MMYNIKQSDISWNMIKRRWGPRCSVSPASPRSQENIGLKKKVPHHITFNTGVITILMSTFGAFVTIQVTRSSEFLNLNPNTFISDHELLQPELWILFSPTHLHNASHHPVSSLLVPGNWRIEGLSQEEDQVNILEVCKDFNEKQQQYFCVVSNWGSLPSSFYWQQT